MPIDQLRCDQNSRKERNEDTYGNNLYELKAIQECYWLLQVSVKSKTNNRAR